MYGLQRSIPLFFKWKPFLITIIFYIYIIKIYIFIFQKSGNGTSSASLCWTQCNLFHRTAMYNECLERFWTLKTQLSGKHILIIFLQWKRIKYIFAVSICIKNMPGVRSIAMKSIRTTILTSKRNRSWTPGALFVKFLLFILGKIILNQNDVKFDFCFGHALLPFPFFWIIINKKCTVEYVRLPHTPQSSHISIYFGHKTLFSPNLIIIITGTFRNTSNYMK